MLNIYSLAEAVSMAHVNGGNGNASNSYVEAYQFHTDNLAECSAEMAYGIMSEAVAINECYAVTEEIMSEAAINNPGVMDTLAEATFQSVVDGVKKFFDKIISFVMGIVDKIKAYFAKTTNNVNKWLEVMKGRVEATMSNQSDWKSVSTEMWTYNVDYIINDMPEGVKSLADQWRADVGATKTSTISGLLKDGASIQRSVNRGDQKTPPAKMDDKSSRIIDELNRTAEEAKNELKKKQAAFPGQVAKAMKVKANSGLDAIWTECGRNAHNGKTEKLTVTYGTQVDEMMKTLTIATETIKNLTATYDGHLKDLQDYRKTLDDAGFAIAGKEATPPPVVNAGRAAYSAKQNVATTLTSMYENAMNKAKDLSLGYMREMCKEYMRVLTGFASHKAAK